MANVFECKKCGQCCEGRGGIIMSPRDMTRLARFLNITTEQLSAAHIEHIAGKPCLKTGPDGYCCFFRSGVGCAVHEGKPDVCRAWPFFRGNLCDPVSFSLAREYCPGIDREALFEVFCEEGRKYMQDNNLFAEDLKKLPNALKQSF